MEQESERMGSEIISILTTEGTEDTENRCIDNSVHSVSSVVFSLDGS